MLKAPFIPNKNADNFDKRHILKEDNVDIDNPFLIRRDSIQALFDGYELNNSRGRHAGTFKGGGLNTNLSTGMGGSGYNSFSSVHPNI